MINTIQSHQNSTNFQTSKYKKSHPQSFGSSFDVPVINKEISEKLSNNNISSKFMQALTQDLTALINKIIAKDGSNDKITYEIKSIIDRKNAPPLIVGDLSRYRNNTSDKFQSVRITPIVNSHEDIAPNGYTFDISDLITKIKTLGQNLASN